MTSGGITTARRSSAFYATAVLLVAAMFCAFESTTGGGFGFAAASLALLILGIATGIGGWLRSHPSYTRGVINSFKRGRCLHCGEAVLDRTNPFCTVQHQDEYESSTAW